MRNNEVHVVHKGGNWEVEVVGGFRTQEEAKAAGKVLAKELKKELVIHGEDGTIKEKDSYGNDPRDVPG